MEINKDKIILGVVVLVLIGGGGYLFYLKKKKDKELEAKEKEEENKPKEPTFNPQEPTFNPQPTAQKLKDAMEGWGTDEDAIWSAMGSLSKSQAKQVATYFDSNLGDGSTLMEWFEGDLSGSDLAKAKSYF